MAEMQICAQSYRNCRNSCIVPAHDLEYMNERDFEKEDFNDLDNNDDYQLDDNNIDERYLEDENDVVYDDMDFY